MSRETKVRAGVLYSNDIGFLSRWGVAPHSLTSSAWELVPYSFVVDWLANVGNYIAALTPKPGVNFLSSWVTTEETLMVTRTLSSFVPGSGWTASSTPSGVDSYIIKTYVRNPGPLQPGLAIDVPSIKSILDGNKRTMDLLSLLISRLSYRKTLGKLL